MIKNLITGFYKLSTFQIVYKIAKKCLVSQALRYFNCGIIFDT